MSDHTIVVIWVIMIFFLYSSSVYSCHFSLIWNLLTPFEIWFLFINLYISSFGDVSLKALLINWQVLGFFSPRFSNLFPLMPGRTFLGCCVPREREHARVGGVFRSHSSNKNGSEGALRNLPSEVCALEQWVQQERARPGES